MEDLGKVNKFGPNAQGGRLKVENAIKTTLLKQSNLFRSFASATSVRFDGHGIAPPGEGDARPAPHLRPQNPPIAHSR